MVLIVTSSFDETVKYMVNKYDKLKKDSFILNVDRLGDYEINVFGEEWCIKHGDISIHNKDVHSIYYRKPSLPDVSEYELKYQYMIQKDVIALINGIVDSFEGTVLSKPCVLRKVENKIFQLIYASKKGWQIPESYIGNSNFECCMRDDGMHIIKPLSTGLIKNDDASEAFYTSKFKYFNDDIAITPVYIQKYIRKKYEVRLTIVDEAFFAVRIDTNDKLDWRKDYEHHRYTSIKCPEDIVKKCKKMLKDFGIEFGAFDFVVTSKGDWIFLEVNPNGQWLWLEKSLKLNISENILEILMRHEKK